MPRLIATAASVSPHTRGTNTVHCTRRGPPPPYGSSPWVSLIGLSVNLHLVSLAEGAKSPHSRLGVAAPSTSTKSGRACPCSAIGRRVFRTHRATRRWQPRADLGRSLIILAKAEALGCLMDLPFVFGRCQFGCFGALALRSQVLGGSLVQLSHDQLE